PGRPGRLRARVRHKDGLWRWIESTAANLLDEPLVAAIVINCRRTDNDRDQHCHAFATRDTGLRTLARTLALDLKEPLLVMMLVTELLMRKAQLNSCDQESVCAAIDRVRHLASSVDELLSAAAQDFHDSLTNPDGYVQRVGERNAA